MVLCSSLVVLSQRWDASTLRLSPEHRHKVILKRDYSELPIVDDIRGKENLNLRRCTMPEKETIERARKDRAEGKSPSTQAGEFVREEVHHVREGKHGVRSAKQAIAIGLSKARRAGVKLPPPKGPASIRRKAEQDEEAGQRTHRKTSRTRQRATSRALRRESRKGASTRSLSRQTKT